MDDAEEVNMIVIPCLKIRSSKHFIALMALFDDEINVF